MTRLKTDILISGGGIAGLTAAVAFGQAGFDVICVDPAPIISTETDQDADLRTTAFLQPAQGFLQKTGIWSHFAAHAAPLQMMRIVDAGGETAEARGIADFDAADISDDPFGWNLPNWLLRRELLAILAGMPRVDLRTGVGSVDLLCRSNEALVRLSDNSRISARLVIGADGRNSVIREKSGIGIQSWRYGQKALVCSVTHTRPHNNVSTEIHRSGGPFTLVPLPDLEGRPRSALVWMDKSEKTLPRVTADIDTFNAEMTARSSGLYGPLSLIGRRAAWPIIAQHADHLIAERVALIAEAAHVVPPIGAQGLNMSLADLAALLEQAEKHREDLGSPEMLRAYETARLSDIRLRVRGIDVLNRASMAEGITLRDLRHAGLKILHNIKPLRKSLMRKGLGVS